MAVLILGISTCSLCEKVLVGGDRVVSFPPFIEGRHKLWKYSDSNMHSQCFQMWDKADAFRSLFDKTWRQHVPNHPCVMDADGTIRDVTD